MVRIIYVYRQLVRKMNTSVMTIKQGEFAVRPNHYRRNTVAELNRTAEPVRANFGLRHHSEELGICKHAKHHHWAYTPHVLSLKSRKEKGVNYIKKTI